MATKHYRGIYAIKPWWQERLARLEDHLVRWHVHPDLITLAGVGCAALMGIVLTVSPPYSLLVLAVAPLAIGRLAANALDGLVARRTDLARPWGEVFNECCDRLSDTLIFIGLAFNSYVNASLAWGMLVLTLLSSYLGIVGKAAGGKQQCVGFLAKADRMIAMGLYSLPVLFLGPAAWNWLLLAFIPATLLTIVQRYRWIYLEFQQ